MTIERKPAIDLAALNFDGFSDDKLARLQSLLRDPNFCQAKTLREQVCIIQKVPFFRQSSEGSISHHLKKGPAEVCLPEEANTVILQMYTDGLAALRTVSTQTMRHYLEDLFRVVISAESLRTYIQANQTYMQPKKLL
jgi:hypothetical protein